MANLVTAYTDRVTNKTVRLNPMNQERMVQFFKALQAKLDQPQNERNMYEADLMRASVGDLFAKAFSSEYAEFCGEWDCSLHFRDIPETSNVFVITLKERNATPRSYQFRFTALR